MYKERDLLGKEVIGAEGSVLGEVLDVIVEDDVPNLVIGKKGFLVDKKRVLASGDALKAPYYYVSTVHDKVLLSKERKDLKRYTP